MADKEETKILIAEFLDPLCSICREKDWSIGVREPESSGPIMYYCGGCWNMGEVKLTLDKKGSWQYSKSSSMGKEKPMTDEEKEQLEKIIEKGKKGDHFD